MTHSRNNRRWISKPTESGMDLLVGFVTNVFRCWKYYRKSWALPDFVLQGKTPFRKSVRSYSFTVIITKGSMSMLLMPNLYGALLDIPKEMQSRGLLSDPCDILFDPSDGRCMSKEVRLIRRSGEMGIEERCARLPDFWCTRTSCL